MFQVEHFVRSFCTYWAAVAKPVRLAFRWRPSLADADDDMVLETAVNGGANAIVTFNQRDFGVAAGSFDCDIIQPGAALRRIRRRP
jgi:predicted nucleic acid-binding protein